MTILTNWWLDFEESYLDGTTGEYSYGPFQYTIDTTISLQNFLDDINNSFSDRVAELRTSNAPYYGIEANIFGGYALKKDDLEKWENILILKTGDIAIKDIDNYFFIKGRLKRFVKIYGNRVNLDEVENFLKYSLNISLLACNGIKNKFILISHSLQGLDETLVKKEIFERYKIHGSSVKFKYFENLPKTQNGKINYKQIEKLYLS